MASISEALRVVLEAGLVPQRTVKVIAYAAEEVGQEGSRDIASTFAAANAKVVAVLQQDMIAYTESPTVDIEIIDDPAFTSPALNQFVRELVGTYLPDLVVGDTVLCTYPCSDNASWAAAGYPAALAFEAPDDLYNPFLHSSSDDVNKLDMTHALKFAKLTTAFLVEAAIDAPLFADDFENGTVGAWSRSSG